MGLIVIVAGHLPFVSWGLTVSSSLLGERELEKRVRSHAPEDISQPLYPLLSMMCREHAIVLVEVFVSCVDSPCCTGVGRNDGVLVVVRKHETMDWCFVW